MQNLILNLLLISEALEEFVEEQGQLSAKKRRHLSVNEVAFLEECLAKYGEDFKKISRDLRLNVWQLTPKQIERKFKVYREQQQQLHQEESS